MIAVDTSVVVAAFASWHEAHRSSLAVLSRGPRVPAHVLLETYSVLTRLPPPHRAPPAAVTEFLSQSFPQMPLTLSARETARLVRHAAEAGITGGAVYDALVGMTAREAGATLVTRDRRALTVYESLGVQYEVVS